MFGWLDPNTGFDQSEHALYTCYFIICIPIGLGKVSKEISRAELSSGLFVSDNGTVSASQDNLSKNHVKKFSEPTGE